MVIPVSIPVEVVDFCCCCWQNGHYLPLALKCFVVAEI